MLYYGYLLDKLPIVLFTTISPSASNKISFFNSPPTSLVLLMQPCLSYVKEKYKWKYEL